MPFQQSSKLPDFVKLKSVFVGAREQIKNYLLFQTIINFLDSTQKMKVIFSKQIEELEGDIIEKTTISNQIHAFLLMGG